jgi:hypothetical protein
LYSFEVSNPDALSSALASATSCFAPGIADLLVRERLGLEGGGTGP